MITIVEGHNAARHARLLDEMFRLRARVFRDALGWDVAVSKGLERDRYDDEAPVYLIHSERADSRVLGSLRLLPTTGPTLLSDVFADTVPYAAMLSAPTIWECTRICVDRELLTGAMQVQAAFQALIKALGEMALRSGIETIVGNFDSTMLKLYRRIGCKVEVLGSTDRFGARIYLGAFPVTLENLRSVGRKVGRPPAQKLVREEERRMAQVSAQR
jgi:N-acyl-L-homoserine lactone synthetase